MKFLCLVRFAPGAFDGMTPEEQRRLDDATIEDDRRLRESGHLLIASPLAGLGEGAVIDRRRLRTDTTDGPFAETKEVIGGFLLIEAASLEEVVGLFADDPIAAYGKVEIRPLNESHRHSETGEARPQFQQA